jgi:hypothetical protein
MASASVQHVCEDDIREAAKRLCESEIGRDGLNDLYMWLDAYGASLDGRNKEAALTLICGVMGPFTGTALDIMRDAIRA